MTESNPPPDNNCSPNNSNNGSEEHINAAYEALELMRKMNLELQCSTSGVMYDDECCTACLLSEPNASSTARFPRLSKWALQMQRGNGDTEQKSPLQEAAEEELATNQNNDGNHNIQTEKNKDTTTTSSSSSTTSRFPRISKLIHSDRKRPKAPPCLLCGTPVCKQHSSNNFSKEGLTVCIECQHLFGLQFVIDFLTEPLHEKRKQSLNHLLDIYDRVVLLLTYSAQYIPTIAQQLEQSKQRQNQIGLGSSSVGLVSGALGMVAAATILTPVGPPLLVASLLFGGGSTAVQTGSEAMHYYSEPQQLAKRIIALHSMLWNVLHISGILRDAMTREHVRSEFYDDESNHHVFDPALKPALDQKKGVWLGAAGMTSLGRYSAVSAEMGQAGSQGARMVTRSTMNVLRGARIARFAGGTMSAAVFVLEAKNVKDTIHAIHSGSPCEQAQQLRVIQEEIVGDSIPDTSTLDNELHRYLTIVEQRGQLWTEEQVAQIILEQNEQACHEEELLEQLKLEQHPEEAHVIFDEELTSTASAGTTSSRNSNLSLLERIALFKHKEKKLGESEAPLESVSRTEATSNSNDCVHDHATQEEGQSLDAHCNRRESNGI